MGSLLVPALNILSAIAAFVAAYFWYRSTKVMAPYEPEAHRGEPSYGAMIIEINGKLFDAASTSALQSRANKRGALAAGFAAAVQGFALLAQGLAA